MSAGISDSFTDARMRPTACMISLDFFICYNLKPDPLCQKICLFDPCVYCASIIP